MKSIRKYVDIDIRDTVNVGIDIDFSELIEIVKQCTDSEKDEILFELKSGGVITDISGRKRVSLYDQEKIDFFRDNFDKISVDQLKDLLK